MKIGKKLSELIKGAPPMHISGLAYDSRLVKKGNLFFAVPGAHVDGHRFIDQAVSNGAVASIVEKPVAAKIFTVRVPSVLKSMAAIAAQFWGNPSHKIPVVGVTGTNGKTTVTFLIEDILRSAKKTCGVMGTVNYRIGKKTRPAPNTTPMALDVQAFLAELNAKKAYAAVMEVSSHALELSRVERVKFKVGVFTNLTQDHLDFHKDMEHYFAAKARLFRDFPGIKGAFNIDDPYGYRLAQEFPKEMTFGFHADADVQAAGAVYNLAGIKFHLKMPSGKKFRVQTNLLGKHNIENLLAAASATLLLGLSESVVIKGLNRKHAVPGRLERVEEGQNFVVVVDYAHTHDALAKVLAALRQTGPNRLICVFGAGGDRDRTKRPKMGRVAVEMADEVIVTSDNPRSENPLSIIKEIEAGIAKTGKNNYAIYVDRTEAIRQAIRKAQKGDIVLIAGKGHENYQIIGDKKFPFSDFDAARKALRK